MKKLLIPVIVLLISVLSLPDDQWQWLPKAKRIDTDDGPLGSNKWSPRISFSGNSVYAVWRDFRNGKEDIYFNYSHDIGATWQASDIRLDMGDLPGNSHSSYPQISSIENNVYVVWQDERNGWRSDIYFNYSHDGGATWQASDIRLNTGDPQGHSSSRHLQISCYENHVYVVWQDFRNGSSDIYFNYSHDKGLTWQALGIRLDTGDSPGNFSSYTPQISSSGNHVYVVWYDYRNGRSDIYFNYSLNSGADWQASDIRLDTGDFQGRSYSYSPQISSFENNIYVTWQDERNCWYRDDIYFNYSQDRGATWLESDIRLDTGDLLGNSHSSYPQISSFGNNVYVVWTDYRNGLIDIYFNCSQDGGMIWLASDVRINTDYDNKPEDSNSYNSQITGSDTRIFVVWINSNSRKDDILFITTNQPPRIRLGEDLSVTKGEGILLDGSLSWDPEDDQLTYNWRILSAPEGSHALFSDRSSVSPFFIPDKVGAYELRLVATDPFGAEGYDKIKVKAVPPVFTLTTRAGRGGTIRPIPGIHSYKQGRKVKLRAIPRDGFVFSHWSGDASGKKNPKIISMYRDKKIKAHFIRIF